LLRRVPRTKQPTASFFNFGKEPDYESELCKRVDGFDFDPEYNPGFRVQPDFVSEVEEETLLKEAGLLGKRYGFKSGETRILAKEGDNYEQTDLSITSARVTGRPEADHQEAAPWGYGDNFDESQVPSLMSEIANRIRETSRFELGSKPLRDITVNFRDGSIFRLDPHVDPALDGGHVFILGLSSDVVLTLTPDLNMPDLRKLKLPPTPEPPTRRVAPDQIALKSWTDSDLDIRVARRTIFYMKDDARYLWKHAIRTGVEAGHPINGICDWWGDLNHLYKRESVRVSIVFAFA
jgi:hypothetical protein